MNEQMKELKDLVKSQAAELKAYKPQVKNRQRTGKYPTGQCTLLSKKDEARHHHIAYSELRGRERHEIEKPREDNLPNESYIRRIKEKYAQVVCDSAA
jgi:hypothetical protein